MPRSWAARQCFANVQCLIEWSAWIFFRHEVTFCWDTKIFLYCQVLETLVATVDQIFLSLDVGGRWPQNIFSTSSDLQKLETSLSDRKEFKMHNKNEVFEIVFGIFKILLCEEQFFAL